MHQFLRACVIALGLTLCTVGLVYSASEAFNDPAYPTQNTESSDRSDEGRADISSASQEAVKRYLFRAHVGTKATPTATATATVTTAPYPTETPVAYKEYVQPTGQGVERWRELVCNAPFTWSCGWALATIECESSGDSNAYNPAGPFIGLFQVLNGPYDPYLNAVEAHIQYVQYQNGVRLYDPWPNCP